MKVFKKHHDRRSVRECRKRVTHLPQHAFSRCADGLAVEALECICRSENRWKLKAPRGSVSAKHRRHTLSVRPMQKTTDSFEKRKIRFCRTQLFQTPADRNCEPVHICANAAQEFRCQGGLAHAGLTANENDSARSSRYLLQQLLKAIDFGLSADKCAGGLIGQAARAFRTGP